MVVYVIGLGSMGKRRTRLLLEREDVEVIGVDSREDRRTEAKNLHGIEAFDSLDAAMEYKKGECAFICTSPLSHAKVINMCLEKGLNVFTELNLVDDMYDENIKLAAEKGLTLFLSSTFLYRNEINYILDSVKNSNSKLDYMYHGGQYLPDWHPWENYNDFFVGNKRTNGCREFLGIELPWIVTCFGEVESINVMKSKNTSLKIDFCDNYMISVLHKNGTKGMITFDVVSRKATRHLEIFGEDLFITWDGTPDSLFSYDIEAKENKKIDAGVYEHDSRYASFITENQYRAEIDDFFATVNDRSHEPKWSFTKDKYVISLMNQIEE